MKVRYAILVALLIASTSASAGLKFGAHLTGEQEVTAEGPPLGTVTDAVGQIEVRFDLGLTKADVLLRFDNISDFDGAHLHCGAAGQNGPVAFGLVSPGSCVLNGNEIDCTLTNADFSGGDCVGTIGRSVENIAALHAAMNAGQIYINVHSLTFPAGEIRGQLLKNKEAFGGDDDDDLPMGDDDDDFPMGDDDDDFPMGDDDDDFPMGDDDDDFPTGDDDDDGQTGGEDARQPRSPTRKARRK